MGEIKKGTAALNEATAYKHNLAQKTGWYAEAWSFHQNMSLLNRVCSWPADYLDTKLKLLRLQTVLITHIEHRRVLLHAAYKLRTQTWRVARWLALRTGCCAVIWRIGGNKSLLNKNLLGLPTSWPPALNHCG